jgi:hypothetical protein
MEMVARTKTSKNVLKEEKIPRRRKRRNTKRRQPKMTATGPQ